MRITWEVDDGYCGKSRPQILIINDDELAECEDEKEREILISRLIQEDFDSTIGWSITGRDDE